MRKIYFLSFLFLNITILFAQEKMVKEYHIRRSAHAPEIDGIIKDDEWGSAEATGEFVMLSPDLGKAEPEEYTTSVRMLYDDNALYVAAEMKDPDAHHIPAQFSTRDAFAQADFFQLNINTYNDQRNDAYFAVLASGTQVDGKMSGGREDISWNAVWESAVYRGDGAWYVEMKIPYSALRFSNKDEQVWSINFTRFRQKTKEEYVWNFVDKEKGSFSEYAGKLTGLQGITPPLRLALYPYVQGSVSRYQGENTYKGTGGMDVKYGINESFTLDATLIPDFSQTAFDDVVLNLGPFEQQYEEKRAFFTEGMELFSKGDLVYSRRIGGTPMLYYDLLFGSGLNENEVVVNNPERNRMYNAVKVSGRTSGGLGIGVFNAVTENTYATIRDTLTGDTREFLTHPSTNYSVIALDQSLPRASYLSFVSTQVFRSHEFDDAIVSSLLYKFKTKNKKYMVSGQLDMSNLHRRTEDFFQWNNGYGGRAGFRKTTGSHRYGSGVKAMDKHYDKNDLGIQWYNNYVTYYASYSYHNFKPINNILRAMVYSHAYLEYRLSPYTYTKNGINTFFSLTNKKFLSYGGGMDLHFGYKYDYYEPRTEGRYYKRHELQFMNAFISTDYNRKFALDFNLFAGKQLYEEKPNITGGITLSPRFRFSPRWQLIYNVELTGTRNDKGYVATDGSKIIFGLRNRRNVVNSAQLAFYPGVKSSFSLVFRHYWARVNYDSQYYALTDEGLLIPDNYTGNHDINRNFWNMDLTYTWEFAPGSQLIAQFRNAISGDDEAYFSDYLYNLRYLNEQQASNMLSLKLIYYLDYNNIRRIF